MRSLLSKMVAFVTTQHAVNRALISRAKDANSLGKLVRSYEMEVLELRAEVDEVRKDSLRIAELYDLVFERLRDADS